MYLFYSGEVSLFFILIPRAHWSIYTILARVGKFHRGRTLALSNIHEQPFPLTHCGMCQGCTSNVTVLSAMWLLTRFCLSRHKRCISIFSSRKLCRILAFVWVKNASKLSLMLSAFPRYICKSFKWLLGHRQGWLFLLPWRSFAS